MQALSDIFALYAELALALAGFTGVASAFSGRERTFRPTELTRLQGILLNAASVLAGCFAFYSASSVELSETEVQTAVATASFLLTVPMLTFVIPAGWRHHNDPDSTSEMWVLISVTLVAIGLLSLYALAAFARIGPGLLVIGFSVQLLFGLWLFVRLLTRPN